MKKNFRSSYVSPTLACHSRPSHPFLDPHSVDTSRTLIPAEKQTTPTWHHFSTSCPRPSLLSITSFHSDFHRHIFRACPASSTLSSAPGLPLLAYESILWILPPRPQPSDAAFPRSTSASIADSTARWSGPTRHIGITWPSTCRLVDWDECMYEVEEAETPRMLTRCYEINVEIEKRFIERQQAGHRQRDRDSSKGASQIERLAEC